MAARTEREIVLETTGLWFRHSEWSVEKFAHERLAPALVEAGLLEPEVIASATGDEYLRCRKAWGQRLNRIFNGTAPFPLEWKQVWIDCLPEAEARLAQQACLDLIGVPNLRLPTLVQPPSPGTLARMSEVLEEVGQFIAAARPSHNGRYDRADDPAEVDRMLKEGTDAVLALINELVAVAAGTGRPLPALQLLINQEQELAHGQA